MCLFLLTLCLLMVPRIVELLMQLFWRQNRYSANNLQYVYKGGQNTNRSSSKTTTVDESASVTRLSSLDTVDPMIQRLTRYVNSNTLKEK